MSESMYYYMVSYFCRAENGEIVPGFTEVSTNVSITHFDQIVSIKEKIESAPFDVKRYDVVIINYQLLRIE